METFTLRKLKSEKQRLSQLLKSLAKVANESVKQLTLVRSPQLTRRRSVMGLRDFWRNYKVLIVMGTSLGLIHWGWYNLKANPLLHKTRDEHVPEPGIVAYVSPPAAKSK